MEPTDFRALISSNRLKVFNHIRKKRHANITSIVKSMKRDRLSVSKDIKALEAFGLVRVQPEKNPGHGQHKVVEPAINENERLILQAEI